MSVEISRFDHVSIAVPDAAAASAFFRDVLGFEEAARRDLRGRDASWHRRHLPLPEGAVLEELVVMRSADLIVECFQVGGDASAVVPPPLSHLAFVVADLDAAVPALAAAGATVFDPLIAEAPMRSWVIVETPWGQRIELVSAPYAA